MQKDKTIENIKDKFREILDKMRSHIGSNGVIEIEERKDDYKGSICRDNKRMFQNL